MTRITLTGYGKTQGSVISLIMQPNVWCVRVGLYIQLLKVTGNLALYSTETKFPPHCTGSVGKHSSRYEQYTSDGLRYSCSTIKEFDQVLGPNTSKQGRHD